MSDDSGSDSGNGSSKDSSSSSSGSKEALSTQKNQSDGDRITRANAGTKNTDSSDWETNKKSADKKPSGGNEVPSAEDVSIPSSVDPDAPASSGGDQSDSTSNSESSE